MHFSLHGQLEHLYKAGKFNPNRDASGRFATSSGKSGGTDVAPEPMDKSIFSEGPSKATRAEEKEVSEVFETMPPKPPRPKDYSQPNAATIDGLYDVALKSKPEFDQKIAKLADGLDAKVTSDFTGAMADFEKGVKGPMVIMGPVKGKERVAEKGFDYAAENNGQPDYSKIGDILRCTVAVDSVQDFDGAIAGLKKQGLSLARDPKLRMTTPTSAGYRDVMINAKLDSGHVVEVQVNTKKMLVAKKYAHKLYEQERSITAKSVKENRKPTKEEDDAVAALQKQQKEIYSKAWKESGG